MTCSPTSSAESIASERRPSQYDDRIVPHATILGPTKFDETNNNVLLPAGWVQVQKGVNEVIWPPSIATSKFQAKPNWKMN